MYETMTYEIILQRMLNKVPSTVDKREGSIIWNALAPAAIEMTQMYIELDSILNESFADTASREMLIKRAAERGIIPSPATKAILKGVFNTNIPINSRFSLDDLNYIVIEAIDDNTHTYKLQCETYGEIGNKNLGTLIPIEYIDGLVSAELIEILVPGEDEEETEVLRKRYFDSLDSQAFGGNIADYKEKVKALSGVGGVKVYPVWNGGGTVKLVIIDSTYSIPSQTLIDSVQVEVDPIEHNGAGVGFAPIGHSVTVLGVTETPVDIVTTITYENGYTWEDIEVAAKAIIDSYFLELNKTWESESALVVRISQIETRFLNITGVLDIAGTTINTLAQNLVLGADSIPVRGEISG